MNVTLLRMLQSIKYMEDNSPIKFKDFNPSTIEATYPDVVVVDQTARDLYSGSNDPSLSQDSPLPAEFFFKEVPEEDFAVIHGPPRQNSHRPKREIITRSLTAAFYITAHWRRKHPRWTIVLKPGLYIDPWLFLHSDPWCEAYEIIGVKNARILIADGTDRHAQDDSVFYFRDIKLKFRNVSIHDRRPERYRDHGTCYHMWMESAVVEMNDCLLTGCKVMMFGGSFTAHETHFDNCPYVCVKHDSRCFITNCFFDASRKVDRFGREIERSSCAYTTFSIEKRGYLSCKGTMFTDYDRTIYMSGSHTDALIENCMVTSRNIFASVNDNASIKIHKNIIDADYLIDVSRNVTGKIDLKANIWSPMMTKTCFIDRMSTKPTHDMKEKLEYEFDGEDEEEEAKKSTALKTRRKEISAYTKAFRRRAARRCAGEEVPKNIDMSLYKLCEFCRKPEDDEAITSWKHGEAVVPKVKYRYCSRCRLVSYCSRECRRMDWPDHRFDCSEDSTSKESSRKTK